MLIRVLILLLLAFPAFAQNYLPMTTTTAAHTRSAQQFQVLQCLPQPDCDKAQVTKEWWPVVALAAPDGSGNQAYVVIQSNGDPCYGPVILAGCGITKSHPGAVATAGLNTAEQATLVTLATVSPTFVQTSAQLWHKGTAVQVTIAAFTDPRGETITYVGVSAQPWLSFDPVGRVWSGTVPAGQATGLINMTVIGTDQSRFSTTQTIGASIVP